MQPRRRAVAVQRGAVTQRRHKPDYVLLVLTAILLVVGLVVIYSISPGLAIQRHVSDNYYVNKQLIAIGLGIVTFLVMATVPFETWRKLQKPLIVAAIIATLVALALPVSEQYPAHRWIRFGGLSFQSVELIKFALIFVLAAFLAERMKRGEVNDFDKSVKPIGIAFVITVVAVAGLQSDLGSTGVLIAILGTMWFVAGLPIKRVLAGVGIVAVILLLAISTSSYRRDRVLTFMNPERDCQAAGYQACQALIAVGTGGLFGKGVGHSVQAYGYLPEAANDSIFAVVAEKFGFIGVTTLLCVFWAFFTRLKNIIERAPDNFTRLVVVGILAWLSTQAIINIGAMIGLLPLKGITLPFISYGGTSLIFATAAVGLVYNISRYTTFGVNDQTEPAQSRVGNQSRRYSLGYSTRR
jgi:cell division protein FtsW